MRWWNRGQRPSAHRSCRGGRAADRRRDRVVVSAIEHDSILDNLPQLRALGFTVDTVKPNRRGYVEPSELEALMGPDVALVSIMFANNETGVIQPVRALSDVAHAHGAVYHADAVQGWLHVPFDVADLGVDALSIAGHKVGGRSASAPCISRAEPDSPAQPRRWAGARSQARHPRSSGHSWTCRRRRCPYAARG
ncbi:MAG: aminotransferase class V-fold PLP-dependent enzyme [Collinsella stercoris]|uniref:aminotransferase class V-fold PLP-dependent enzyme n=1 Tax=Collinsella stercoris TaxID=147206 RepID=UPI0039943453